MGFGVWGLGFGVWGLGFRDRVWSLGFGQVFGMGGISVFRGVFLGCFETCRQELFCSCMSPLKPSVAPRSEPQP